MAEPFDAPDAIPDPAEPTRDAGVDLQPSSIDPPEAAAGRRGAYFIAAVGAATVGAIVTMAVLGGRPAAAPAAALPAARPAPHPAERARSSVPRLIPHWNQAHEGRWISNHPRSVAYEVDASELVTVWMGRVRPTLVVRCLARSTDVFVFTGSAAQIEARDDNHTVRIGFDDEPDVTARWPDSADHDALFAPDPAGLVKRLVRARSMRFAFTPHNAPPAATEFEVEGFDAVAASMGRTCGWKDVAGPRGAD